DLPSTARRVIFLWKENFQLFGYARKPRHRGLVPYVGNILASDLVCQLIANEPAPQLVNAHQDTHVNIADIIKFRDQLVDGFLAVGCCAMDDNGWVEVDVACTWRRLPSHSQVDPKITILFLQTTGILQGRSQIHAKSSSTRCPSFLRLAPS